MLYINIFVKSPLKIDLCLRNHICKKQLNAQNFYNLLFFNKLPKILLTFFVILCLMIFTIIFNRILILIYSQMCFKI